MESLFKDSGQSSGVELKNIGHKKLIIRTIYFKGPVTSAELTRNLQLSTPKINSLLQELISEGLLKELGQGSSSGGRRPAIYGLVEDGFYVIGITINIYRTIISVFSANNREISGPHYIQVPIQRNFSMFEKVNEKLQEIIDSLGFVRQKIIAVGIEMPGLVNRELCTNRTYFPETKNLKDRISELFGFPVFFDNDSRIRIFAEQQFGLARDRENVLMLHADWGIGLGLILNGELYAGKSGFSGEFGHIPMVENGEFCHCGKRGCLEAMASVTAIVRNARIGIMEGNTSLLVNLSENNPDNIDINMIIDAAMRGDQYSISVFTEAGRWLGKGVAQLIQVFNPELIIVGGKLAEAGQFLEAPLRQAIFTYSNPDISADTEIVSSAMGIKAGAIGSAAFALDKLAR